MFFLIKWRISIQLCYVAEEIYPSWDPTWWKFGAALSLPPFGCSNMKSGNFSTLAYTSQVIHLKQPWPGCRGFPWPWPGGGFAANGGAVFHWKVVFSHQKLLTRFCHEYVIAKGTGLSSACSFGWKNLQDQSLGSVFLDNMKSRESEGLVRESSKKLA